MPNQCSDSSSHFSGHGVRLLLVRDPGRRAPLHPGPHHPPPLRPPDDRLHDFQALHQRRQVNLPLTEEIAFSTTALVFAGLVFCPQKSRYLSVEQP